MFKRHQHGLIIFQLRFNCRVCVVVLQYTRHTPPCLKHLHARIFTFHTAFIIPIINIIIKTFTLHLKDKICLGYGSWLEPRFVFVRVFTSTTHYFCSGRYCRHISVHTALAHQALNDIYYSKLFAYCMQVGNFWEVIVCLRKQISNDKHLLIKLHKC